MNRSRLAGRRGVDVRLYDACIESASTRMDVHSFRCVVPSQPVDTTGGSFEKSTILSNVLFQLHPAEPSSISTRPKPPRAADIDPALRPTVAV